MSPFWLQLPAERAEGVSQMICGAALCKSIFFNFPEEKNASERPSGDQKAPSTSSVPGITSAVNEPSSRIQSCLDPSGPTPMKITRSPLGETAIESASGVVTKSGGVIRKLTALSSGGVSRKCATASHVAMTATVAVGSQ